MTIRRGEASSLRAPISGSSDGVSRLSHASMAMRPTATSVSRTSRTSSAARTAPGRVAGASGATTGLRSSSIVDGQSTLSDDVAPERAWSMCMAL